MLGILLCMRRVCRAMEKRRAANAALGSAESPTAVSTVLVLLSSSARGGSESGLELRIRGKGWRTFLTVDRCDMVSV